MRESITPDGRPVLSDDGPPSPHTAGSGRSVTSSFEPVDGSNTTSEESRWSGARRVDDGSESADDLLPPPIRLPHDPTGTDVAERIAAAARGVTPVKRRRRRVKPDVIDVEWSGAGPSARDPQPAGLVLDAVLTRRGWKKHISVASLLQRWPDFVGDVNAAHTTPEKWEAGVLTIAADSTTWATSLRAMAPQIIAKMNEILGPKTVTRLAIHGPHAPSWKKGPRSVRGRGPRDTYG